MGDAWRTARERRAVSVGVGRYAPEAAADDAAEDGDDVAGRDAMTFCH